ncbi:hypothetical protein PTTG_28612 [Puccinia triticina 1-1 BBBD Race 1]|uniref:Uncharacterized protein n=1 Tax=Puccinia triticina (isolate 1-1 / race 1 (BBBD)) TaxID=630390 RepID=A0A180GCP3_PUCT1|nr:hypothetical protein PTTG_28612 [Puccinia triticina 1-1 BBBD Race 1]
MRTAIRKLITAVPEDLSKLHDLKVAHTRDWIENVTRHYHKTLPPVPQQKPNRISTKRSGLSDHTNTPKTPKRIRKFYHSLNRAKQGTLTKTKSRPSHEMKSVPGKPRFQNNASYTACNRSKGSRPV